MTINNVSRFTSVVVQAFMFLLLWVRVEQVAIQAQDALSRAQWAAATIAEGRKG